MNVWMVEVNDTEGHTMDSLWFTRDLAVEKALKLANASSIPVGWSKKTVKVTNLDMVEVMADTGKRDQNGKPIIKSVMCIWVTEETVGGDAVSRLAAVSK